MSTDPEIEERTIRSFVCGPKQDRYLSFIGNQNRREKFLRELYHFHDLEPSCLVQIPSGQQNQSNILQLLKARGAGDNCYAISTHGAIDGRTLPISEALSEVIGQGHGTFLSCVPGRLAYFEGESAKDRFLLVHA